MLKAIIKLMLKIKNKKISQSHRPYIIAEMSANHNGSLEKALKIVDAAADSGANALKLQTYTANTLTMKSNKKIFFVFPMLRILNGAMGDKLSFLYLFLCFIFGALFISNAIPLTISSIYVKSLYIFP